MRILLDAKDLINVVEHSTPLPLSDLVNWLNESNAQLVLTAMSLGSPRLTRWSIGAFTKKVTVTFHKRGEQ